MLIGIGASCLVIGGLGENVGRRNGTSASKVWVGDVFAKLHAQHFSPAIIAKVTGYSPQYVRQMLDARGLIERWTESVDVLAALPADLFEACLKLRDQSAHPIHK